MPTPSSLDGARRFASWILGLNVLVASGFAVAGLIKPELIAPPGASPNGASAVFAMYAAARTLALALVALVAVARKSVPALLILGVLAAAIQAVDGVIGLGQQDLGKSIGPFVIAAAQVFAVYRLNKAAGRT